MSTKINMIIYLDGFKESIPDTRELPRIGERISTNDAEVVDGELVMRRTFRTVKEIVPWEERRENMAGVCANCHSSSFAGNFYEQFDSLVNLYNDKFATVAQGFMKELTTDGILNPDAPFGHQVQWIFWEFWHHEERRARHGASMMGPDYTHWHGM